MKKILVVITTSFVPWGGLASVAMNYYRAMDKKDLRMDFVSSNNAPQSLVSELNSNDDKYICLPDRKKALFKYMAALYKILKKGEYDIIHIHGNSATMTFELLPAWFAGVKKRMVHVHTTKNQHRLVDKILRPLFYVLLTDSIAVSEESGKYMYGKKNFTVLNNAIDVEHYKFQKNARQQCRDKYGISEDKYVLGNIGKLNEGKNQKFLINVLVHVIKKIPNAVLLIVGGGELEQELLNEAKALNVEDRCFFVGMQDDTAEFLSAMDIFLFPSLYEGLGMAAVEAQASGLPVLASTNVPALAGCTDLFKQLELDKGVEFWAETIVKMREQELSRLENREKEIKIIGFDIQQECIKLERIYGDGKNG